MPDIRKTLDELRSEWEDCTKCSLGERRQAVDGAFVFGEGDPGAVMFVGEGPGRVEEEEGRPFVGDSGQLIRRIINKVGLTKYYITNIVACRSCIHRLDAQGQPMFRTRKGAPLPVYQDQPPSPTQISACLERLYEEIYLVDPVVIVTLGATASEALLRHPVTITKVRGNSEHCFVPGATYRPVLTEKKGVWARKLHGKLELPTERNEVAYEVVPTIHPAYVIRKLADKSGRSPLAQLVADVRLAARIYEKYLQEAFGILPTVTDIAPEDEDLHALYDEEPITDETD